MIFNSKPTTKGFTIVELIIVIVVIGILATITIVAYAGIQNRAKAASSQSAASQGAKKIMLFAVQNSENYPAILSEVGVVDTTTASYQYSVNNNVVPRTFCLTAKVSSYDYYVSNTQLTPIPGVCAGHSEGVVVAITCPSGFIIVPGSSTFSTTNFCVMKYEAKQASATVPVSQAAGTPWGSITQADAATYSANVAGCTGCHLITENEWLTISQNVMSVASNWSGGSVGNGFIYSGTNDGTPANPVAASTSDSDGYYLTGNTSGNQRRTLTLTNGEVIWDIAGNVWDTTAGLLTGNQPGAPGWAYREWNAIADNGSLNANVFPSFANPVASSWTSVNGIGQLYSSTTNSGINRAFVRGGGWGDTTGAGIYGLNLSVATNVTGSGIGFRVAR